MTDERMKEFEAWFYSEPHRQKYMRHHPAFLAAKEAWQAFQRHGGEAVVKQIADDMEAAEPHPDETGYMWDARDCANWIREHAHRYANPQPAVPEGHRLVPASHWASIKYHAFNGHQDRPEWKRFSLIQDAIRQAESEHPEPPEDA